MFHYCSGIFIISLLWEHNFFPPFFFFRSVPSPRVYILFTASSPEFSWKCSVFSTRILRLSNRVLRHKTLKQRWKRRRDGTDKQGHKASEEWGERWRQTGRERKSVCVCVQPTYFCVMTKHFFSLFFFFLSPNFTGSRRTCAAKCTCSAQLCSDFDVDEPHLTCLMVHSSPAASVQCPSVGGYAFFSGQ